MAKLTIKRSSGLPEGISLAEWQAYIASSTIVKLSPSRKFLDPFTGEQKTFHPSQGAAYFFVDESMATIEFKGGVLFIKARTAAAELVVQQIAADLNAIVVENDRA